MVFGQLVPISKHDVAPSRYTKRILYRLAAFDPGIDSFDLAFGSRDHGGVHGGQLLLFAGHPVCDVGMVQWHVTMSIGVRVEGVVTCTIVSVTQAVRANLHALFVPFLFDIRVPCFLFGRSFSVVLEAQVMPEVLSQSLVDSWWKRGFFGAHEHQRFWDLRRRLATVEYFTIRIPASFEVHQVRTLYVQMAVQQTNFSVDGQ
jgi:hypothetical protein